MRHCVPFLITLLALSLATTDPAAAQSRFVSDGTNAVGFNAGYSSGDGFHAFGAAVGYVFAGKVDLGVGMSRTSFDDDLLGSNGSATDFTPFVGVSLLKPTVPMPVGMELSLSYAWATYSGDLLDTTNWDMSGTVLDLGGTVYLKVAGPGQLAVFPAFSLDYVSADVTTEDNVAHFETTTTEGLAYGLSAALLVGERVSVVPSYSRFEGSGTIALRVGVIVPGN